MATILVVDDEEGLRSVARKALEGAGHTVLEAGDGRVAMAILESTVPDLVITDLLMPEQEGLQTIREIRRRRIATSVLAVSGGGRTARMDFLDIAKDIGADRTLAKPFRVRELLTTVEEMLNDRPPSPT